MSSTLDIVETGQKSLEAKRHRFGLRFFSLIEVKRSFGLLFNSIESNTQTGLSGS